MTQRSYFWTTGGAGDGASTYDRAALSAAFAIYAAVSDDEGVAPNYLNQLAATIPAANTVRINTGAAVVDGKAYLNDASLDQNVPNAIGAGNTRIDRIVLRADWTAQTVRVTRVAGVDAATPTAPAITQVPGATFDILLYQVTVNTSGTVTVTVDERVMGRIQTNGIADDAVTPAKLQYPGSPLRYRQGSSSSDWIFAGSTQQSVGETAAMQAGVVSMTTSGSQLGGWYYAVATITLPTQFTKRPLVFVTPYSASISTAAFAAYQPDGTDSATFYIVLFASAPAVTWQVSWLAIGPM